MSHETAHRLWVAEDAPRGRPALLVDRDGTLIEDPGYLSDPDKVRLLPQAVETLQAFRDAGYALVLITNQSGVGRGYFGWGDYDAVAAAVRAQLGLAFDAEAVCGHAPGAADCDWRKPSPGMILAAARALDLDLPGSVMIGDKLSDLVAAAAARVPRLIHVLTGHGAKERAAVLASALDIEAVDDLSRVTCGS